MAEKDDLERVLDKFEELHEQRSEEIKELREFLHSLQESTSVMETKVKNIDDKSGDKLSRLEDEVDKNSRWRNYLTAVVIFMNALMLYLLQAAGILF